MEGGQSLARKGFRTMTRGGERLVVDAKIATGESLCVEVAAPALARRGLERGKLLLVWEQGGGRVEEEGLIWVYSDVERGLWVHDETM